MSAAEVELASLRAALESMGTQLDAVYEEKDRLDAELGVSDAEGLIALVRSLRAQLAAEREERGA